MQQGKSQNHEANTEKPILTERNSGHRYTLHLPLNAACSLKNSHWLELAPENENLRVKVLKIEYQKFHQPGFSCRDTVIHSNVFLFFCLPPVGQQQLMHFAISLAMSPEQTKQQRGSSRCDLQYNTIAWENINKIKLQKPPLAHSPSS